MFPVRQPLLFVLVRTPAFNESAVEGVLRVGTYMGLHGDLPECPERYPGWEPVGGVGEDRVDRFGWVPTHGRGGGLRSDPSSRPTPRPEGKTFTTCPVF